MVRFVRMRLGFAIICALIHLPASGEQQIDPSTKILKPKTTIRQPVEPKEDDGYLEEDNVPAHPAPPPLLARPPQKKPAVPQRDTQASDLTVSFLIHTPLFKENAFDARFSSLGLTALLSVPLIPLFEPAHLHVEAGVVTTVSRLTLAQPSTTFTHVYFDFPLRLRLVFPLQSMPLLAEIFAGAQFKIFEYDSRPTTDGGFHTVRGITVIQPDFGAGVSYLASSSLRIRLSVGYLALAAGVELSI